MPQFHHPLRLYRGLRFLGALVAVSSITACSDDDDKCINDPTTPGCFNTGGSSTGGRSAATSTGGSATTATSTGGSVSTGGAVTTTGIAGAAGEAPQTATGGAITTGGASGAPGSTTGGAAVGTAGTPATGGAVTTAAGSPSTGGTTAAAGSGTGGASVKVCTNPATDCPVPANECVKAVCNGQVCGTTNVVAGTATTAGQTAGDCKVKQCDGAGNITTANDDTDKPVDTNPCTTEACASGTPSASNTAAGTACETGKKCDGTGQCVACVDASDCPGTDTECQTRTCTAGACGVANKALGTASTTQIPNDCHKVQCDGAGAVATVVDDTDVPNDGKTCTTDICTAGVPSHGNEPNTLACGTGLLCDGAGKCIGCTLATDCTGTDTECQARVCTTEGECTVNNTAAGTATTSQTAADCKKNQCDGLGNIVIANDDTDLPNDSNACTADTCTAGTLAHSNVDARTACGSALICDGLGACVSCIDATDCPGSDTDCQKRTCTAGTCGVTNTAVGTATSTQVPGDCHTVQCDGAGSSANNVDDLDVPNDSKECTTDACASGVPSNTNKAADVDCTEAGGKVCDGHGVCGPYNLAGNGSLEYGTLDGWSSFGGTLALSNTTASGFAHDGQYSLLDSGRTAAYNGPAYQIPAGPGKYIISVWGMQNEQTSASAVVNVALTCGTDTSNGLYPSVGASATLDSGVWKPITGTVDTAAADPKCVIATPGAVRAATLYLNGGSSPFASLFIDDLVVQVTDGHNLIGVPTFELAGQMGAWLAGGGTAAISTTQFHSGLASLGVTTRTANWAGPTYPLPIGKAVYNLSVWAMHTGTVAHNLVMTVAYRCVGDTADRYAQPASATAVAANTWTSLSATNWKMPPTSAPAGCRLTAAKFYVHQEDTAEYPDLFIDDASLTVAP